MKRVKIIGNIFTFLLISTIGEVNIVASVIIHGTNDQSVDYGSAKEFADKMTKLGNVSNFIQWKGPSLYLVR